MTEGFFKPPESPSFIALEFLDESDDEHEYAWSYFGRDRLRAHEGYCLEYLGTEIYLTPAKVMHKVEYKREREHFKFGLEAFHCFRHKYDGDSMQCKYWKVPVSHQYAARLLHRFFPMQEPFELEVQ